MRSGRCEWKSHYKKCPKALKRVMKRYFLLMRFLPAVSVGIAVITGWITGVLFLLVAEIMTAVCLFFLSERFFKGDYISCFGEIVKMDIQTGKAGLLNRKCLITIETEQHQLVMVKMPCAETAAFKEGLRLAVYAPGGRLDHQGVFECFGYYTVYAAEKEKD